MAASDQPDPLDPRTLERYEAGLSRLPSGERDLVIGAVELGLGMGDLATRTGLSSDAEARSACVRALLRLAEDVGRHG